MNPCSLWLAALNNLPEPMAVTDLNGQFVFVNAAFTRFNGYSRAETEGRTPNLLKSGLTDPAVYANLWREIGHGRPFTGTVVNRRKNGDHYEAELTVVPLRDDAGAVTHYLSTHRDLSLLLSAQGALRRSEASLRALIEGLPEAIAVHRNGLLVFVNPAVLTLLGYQNAEQLLGRPVQLLLDPSARLTSGVLLDEGAITGPQELTLVRRDGTTVSAEVTSQRLVFDDLPAIVLQARDLTLHKRLTAQMMHMDRMAAVGTLAAGVGHEIKNQLAYLIANLDFVAEQLPAISSSVLPQVAEIEAALREARDGASRVRNVVRDLGTFSRAGSERREDVVLPKVVDSAINIAFSEIRNRARVVKDFTATPPVLANESRLSQVVLNLLVNAAHAIPEGQPELNEIRITLAPDGEHGVLLAVRDTGSGIPPEVLPKIFDPFFTTKPPGQGTGLGLSICHGIIHALGGTIDVASELKKGTTFTVRLPAEASKPQAPAVTVPPPPRSPRGRLLFIDDEPMVGMALARPFAKEHDVKVVNSGQAALALFEAGERFDLIFCDLMMPEMNGIELYDALAGRFAEQATRMIFLSGGAYTPLALQFLDRVSNLRLEKPLELHQLRALVRDRMRPPTVEQHAASH
jgi:PAS domain S-box-containing protein